MHLLTLYVVLFLMSWILLFSIESTWDEYEEFTKSDERLFSADVNYFLVGYTIYKSAINCKIKYGKTVYDTSEVFKQLYKDEDSTQDSDSLEEDVYNFARLTFGKINICFKVINRCKSLL